MKKNVVYTSDISCCCHANWQSSSIHSGKTQVIACTAKWAATCETYIRITDDIKGKSNDYLRPLFFTYSKIQNFMLSDGLCHLLMATIVTGVCSLRLLECYSLYKLYINPIDDKIRFSFRMQRSFIIMGFNLTWIIFVFHLSLQSWLTTRYGTKWSSTYRITYTVRLTVFHDSFPRCWWLKYLKRKSTFP